MKKIAIIGTAASWKDAPFDDPTWEKWIVPGVYPQVMNPDRLYEVHHFKHFHKTFGMDLPRMDWLKGLGEKFYVHPSLKSNFPESTIIDYPGLIKTYGSYFGSSISWMLADAIAQEPSTIGLWGVDMAAESLAYAHQKPSCTFFLGWASAKGIKILIPENSELMALPYIYGLQDPPQMIYVLEKQKAEAQYNIDKFEYEIDEARKKLYESYGYKKAIENFQRNFGGHDAKPAEAK